jgi:hypothetical protein
MKLKTAALITLIGIMLHLIINLLLLLQPVRPDSIITFRLFSLFNILLFDSSIVLFFCVLYYKQRKCVKGNISSNIFETDSTTHRTVLKEGECSDIENAVQHAHGKKVSPLAKASFILSLAAIPFVVICSVIMQIVIYNPPLTEIARAALYVSYALILLSFLLGIGGLTHITLKRKSYYGYWMSLAGIGLSVILIVSLFYNLLRAMGEHIW